MCHSTVTVCECDKCWGNDYYRHPSCPCSYAVINRDQWCRLTSSGQITHNSFTFIFLLIHLFWAIFCIVDSLFISLQLIILTCSHHGGTSMLSPSLTPALFSTERGLIGGGVNGGRGVQFGAPIGVWVIEFNCGMGKIKYLFSSTPNETKTAIPCLFS